MIRRIVAVSCLLVLAGCGEDAVRDGGLTGSWKNSAGTLSFDDGDLVRKAGRVNQKGRYKLYDVTGKGGRVVIVLDGQKLSCKFTIVGEMLTLAEPCASNFDGGSFSRGRKA